MSYVWNIINSRSDKMDGLLPIVYQLTLDAALKFHGKSQIPAWSWKTLSQRLPFCLNRKKHIVCKLNMSFGLFHCCELTSCGFSASLFEIFFFFLSDHTSFFSPIFHYYLILFFFAGCSTPVMCRHISWTLDYVVKNAHWVTRIIE